MSAQAKKPSFNLSMSIGSDRVKPLTKPIINLAPAEAKRQVQIKYIALALLALVGIGAFYKFLIVDQQAKLTREQQAVAELQQQLDEARKTLEELGQSDMEGEYYHLTYDGMTEDELALVDRVEVMEMLERVLTAEASAETWTLSGNELAINLDTITLEEANQTMQRFLDEDLVVYCNLSTVASISDTDSVDGADGGDQEEEEIVTASIFAYLANPVEEEEEDFGIVSIDGISIDGVEEGEVGE